MKHQHIAAFLGSRDCASSFSTCGIHLGMSKESVVAQLGEPKLVERDSLFYDQVGVQTRDDVVETISIFEEKIANELPLEAFDELLILTGEPDSKRGRAGHVCLSFTERDFHLHIQLSPFKVESLKLGHSSAKPYRFDDSWQFANDFFATVDQVRMYRTYAGLLEGVPTDEMNDNIMESFRDIASKNFGGWPRTTP